LCLSEWTQAGFGFVINEYLRGGERRQRKTHEVWLKSEHANPTLLSEAVSRSQPACRLSFSHCQGKTLPGGKEKHQAPTAQAQKHHKAPEGEHSQRDLAPRKREKRCQHIRCLIIYKIFI